MNAVTGTILLLLALLHVFIPEHLHYIALYGSGSLFAFVALRQDLSQNVARLFAIGTTAVMFFYFAGFFTLAPHFHEYWYRSGVGLEGVGLLLSAFAMIPVLSCYSCLLKADCAEQLAAYERSKQEEAKGQTSRFKRPAFFSVPEHIQEKSA
ncbi:MAG: hypothetical protein AAF541_03225 [Pseudomonadota bacterium]